MIWHHNDYSEEAILEMQKEAEDRIKEMQSRTRLFSENGQIDKAKKQNSGGFQIRNNIPPHNDPFGAISGMLQNLDGDRLIIVAIMWLLWNEHADNKLLLALFYILI